MYVYIKSEPQLWTVGFYNPSGEWIPESDHNNTNDAANRVAWLNGNSHGDTKTLCQHKHILSGRTPFVSCICEDCGEEV